MTLPTVYPTGFSGTATDFTLCKADRSGALRSSAFTLTTPAVNTAATVIGLVPVKKGARLHLPGCRISNDDLDSGNTVTCSIGIVYDDTVNNTSVPAQYVATTNTGLQSAQTFTLLTTNAADTYVATGNGWVAITTATASTTTAGTIHGVIAITYDSSLQ